MTARQGTLWRIVAATTTVVVLGCQSAFERDSAYGRRPVAHKPTAPQKSSVQTTAFEDVLRLAPTNAAAEAEARFSCDVARPSDAALAPFADATLALAYRHARGEDRKGIATSGAQSVRDAFFDDYREWFAEDWASVTNGDVTAHVMCWSCRVEGRVRFCDARHFSYRAIIDTYCGGAHPNRWVQNATYARCDGRRLTAADVIRPESMTAVVNLIRKALRGKTLEDEHLHGLLAEEIRQPYADYVRDIRAGKREEWGNPLVTDNFILTQDGIVWTYNQYEIACYASGWFDVLVPWNALRPHLRTP